MLLPRREPIHIYEFLSWSRAVIVPLLIIFDRKPVAPLALPEQCPEQCPELQLTRTRPPARSGFDLERVLAIAQIDGTRT